MVVIVAVIVVVVSKILLVVILTVVVQVNQVWRRIHQTVDGWYSTHGCLGKVRSILVLVFPSLTIWGFTQRSVTRPCAVINPWDTPGNTAGANLLEGALGAQMDLPRWIEGRGKEGKGRGGKERKGQVRGDEVK